MSARLVYSLPQGVIITPLCSILKPACAACMLFSAARFAMPKTRNSAVQIREKIKRLQQDIVYQTRYIAGLQNADLFPAAFSGLDHLERSLEVFRNALDPSQIRTASAGAARLSANTSIWAKL